MAGESNLTVLLREMEPVLNTGTYVFVTLPPGCELPPGEVVASMREPEGVSVILAQERADALGLAGTYPCAWITLRVQSDLAAVGLTAAVSGALAAAGISCNVVAGTCHDHLFVPASRAADAIGILHRQATAQDVSLRAGPS